MTLIRAFTGLRPANEFISDVVAPPYDVMNATEAREMVAGKPWSFLHISRPEVDLPVDTNPYSSEVYTKAAENLQHMINQGVMRRDTQASYYVYRLTMGTHVQTGLVAAASVDAYDQNRIKKHEFTRPAKEDDRVNQIEALRSQTGPVFLVYPSHNAVDNFLSGVAKTSPDMDVTADDDVRHEVWCVDDINDVTFLTQAFDAMPALYVADGHHRSAAASRVAATSKAANSQHNGEEAYNYFLTVIFPHNQMQILDYNRVITDLNGLTSTGFLTQVKQTFKVRLCDQAFKPQSTGEFGMYLNDQWYALTLSSDKIPSDPVASLDVSLLADNLIDPILGISDPRRDNRIDFVGGIRGLVGLEKRVDSGDFAVAFSMYATTMEALMSVADANEVMPPKSTWFEPKLADGLVSHMLD